MIIIVTKLVVHMPICQVIGAQLSQLNISFVIYHLSLRHGRAIKCHPIFRFL